MTELRRIWRARQSHRLLSLHVYADRITLSLCECIRTYIYMYVHIHTHTYMYIHIHTYTHIFLLCHYLHLSVGLTPSSLVPNDNYFRERRELEFLGPMSSTWGFEQEFGVPFFGISDNESPAVPGPILGPLIFANSHLWSGSSSAEHIATFTAPDLWRCRIREGSTSGHVSGT